MIPTLAMEDSIKQKIAKKIRKNVKEFSMFEYHEPTNQFELLLFIIQQFGASPRLATKIKEKLD